MTRAVARGAIILAGGRATRLGGADKPRLEIDGAALIDTVVAAVSTSAPVIVAGPEDLARPGIRAVRENPPFGGPVAALAAALPLVPDEVDEVWLLACDLPRAVDVVDRLEALSLAGDVEGAILQDADGRDQPLAGRHRVRALRRALEAIGEPSGASLRQLLAPLNLLRVVDADGASIDLDTWEDVAAYRASHPTGTIEDDEGTRS